MSDRRSASTPPGLRISRWVVLFVYGLAIAATIILATDFFLELFNANETTPFVGWVDRASSRFMQPFRGIFPPVEGESGSVFEPALLFGIFMYWLLAIGMQALVAWIDRKIAEHRAAARWEAAHRTPTTPPVVQVPPAEAPVPAAYRTPPTAPPPASSP